MRELNLIPYEIKRKNEKKQNLSKVLLCGAVLLCIAFLLAYIPEHNAEKLEKEMGMMELRVKENSSFIDENQSMTDEIKNMQAYIDKVSEITERKVSVTSRLRSLKDYVPADITAVSISYEDGKIVFNGSTKSFSSIYIMAANLQEAKFYRDVRIVAVSKDTENKGLYTFTIGIDY